MELFLELAFTIAFSLISSFCFAWFLSIADAAEHDLTKKKTSHVLNVQEEFEVCNLELETKVGFGSELRDDQRPKLFTGEVEKTEEKLLDEAQEAETQMGSENKTTQFQEESEDCNWGAETEIGFSSKSVNLDDQSPELHPGKVEETDEKSLNGAQEAKTQMGLTKEEVGIEEKEEKDHNSTENKTALVHKVGLCSKSVKLDDQRLKLSPVEAEETEEKLVDEAQDAETEMGLIEGEVDMEEKEEIGMEKRKIDSGDWVGIERSELERLFGAAVAFVDSKKEKTSSFSSELKLQFFGLYQVAMAGPCLLPQPMALKFAARAKWDAWHQLGNMSSEEAMEHYVNLLSSNVPGWMQGNASGFEISNDSRW